MTSSCWPRQDWTANRIARFRWTAPPPPPPPPRYQGLYSLGRDIGIPIINLRRSTDQAIIWTNAVILLTGPLGTNFSEILINIHSFSFKKIPLKRSSAKWRAFCRGLNVLGMKSLFSRCARKKVWKKMFSRCAIRLGTLETHWPAFVIIIVADVMKPNQTISNHRHTDFPRFNYIIVAHHMYRYIIFVLHYNH